MTLKTFDLTGRRALITGSGSGIGLAYAEGLAGAGCEIVLNGRDKGKLAGAEAALKAKGYRVSSAAFDVTDPAAVTAGVDAIERQVGPIDVLVNNAGMTIRQPLEDFADDAWRRVMATNIDSVFYVSKAVARHMLPKRLPKASMVKVAAESTVRRPRLRRTTSRTSSSIPRTPPARGSCS